MYICIYASTHVCTRVPMYACTHVYMYICIYVYMYVCICVFMYICLMYLHMCIYFKNAHPNMILQSTSEPTYPGAGRPTPVTLNAMFHHPKDQHPLPKINQESLGALNRSSCWGLHVFVTRATSPIAQEVLHSSVSGL